MQADEPLVLAGPTRSIVRVEKGQTAEGYMLKNQRFSSLFRWYAKTHGLRKEELAFSFTNRLRNEVGLTRRKRLQIWQMVSRCGPHVPCNSLA